jgi:hypothetical protein
MAETSITESPKLARGWKRYQELRAQDAAERDRIEAALLNGLGRQPTEPDRLAAEQIASLTVWARIQERRGDFRGAAATRQQLTQAWRASPTFKPQPVASQKPDPAADAREWLNNFKKPSSEAPA